MNRRLASLGVLSVATLLLVDAPASAAQFEYHRTYLLPAHETESRELWLAARQIQIDGAVERSFFAVARDAQLRGVFEQDIWLAGVNLHLTPAARQSVRAAARDNLIFEGQAAGTMMAAAGEVLRLGSASHIREAAYLAAPTIIVEGAIDGRLVANGSRVVINGRIGGDATVRAHEMVMGPHAAVEGRLRHIAEKPVPADADADAWGRRGDYDGDEGRTPTWQRANWWTQIYFYLAAVLVGLCFIGMAPRLTGQSVRAVRHSFWKSALVGVLALILIPLASILVAFTFIGLPLSFLVLLVYGLMLYLSKIVVATALGGLMLRRRGQQSFGVAASAMLLGLLFLYLFANLPIVGAVAWFIVSVIGLGALILGMRGVEYATVAPPVPAAPQNDFEYNTKE